MLARLCSSQMPIQDRQRGEGYFRAGRAILTEWDDLVAYAEVQGSRRDPYDVELNYSEVAAARRLSVFCSCPRFEDSYTCKHIWASILALDHKFPGINWGSGPVKIEHSDDVSFWGFPGSLDDDDDPIGTRGLETDPAAIWRDRLWRVRQLQGDPPSPFLEATEGKGEAYFLLNARGFYGDSGLLVDLYQRQPLKTGELGKLKPLSLAEEVLPSFAAPEDRQALALLLGTPDPRVETQGAYSYSRYDQTIGRRRALVPDALAELLLPRLAATGRFYLFQGGQGIELEEARLLAWDDGPPWRPDLRLEEVDGGARVFGQLTRGNETHPLEDLLFVGGSNIALLGNTWTRIEETGAQPWLMELSLEGELRVPAADLNDFLAQLWHMPALEALQLPEAMRLETEILQPRPHLTLRPSKYYGVDFLDTIVSFDYGGRSVGIGSGPPNWADAVRRKLFQRDPAAERQAYQSLLDRGWKAYPEYFDKGAILYVPGRQLLKTVGALLEEGWEIEGEKGAYRSANAFNLKVTSDIDWFTLDGTVGFAGQDVPLPEILRGMRDGSRFVQLGDGSTGVLPEPWFQRLQELAGLGVGGKLRFTSPQALLLDALLSVKEDTIVERAPSFVRLRDQMATLADAPAAAQPRGFQGDLRPYQSRGLGWLQALGKLGLGGCLADDMGLGKTIQVLALLQSRRFSRKKSEHRPSIAVVPKTLVHNWVDEARRFTPGLEVFEWVGTDRAARWEAAGKVDLIVTTYGTLRRDVETLSALELDYAILDEAQAIKNSKSQTAKACRLLAAPRRLALTGTPVENSLLDLWSIFEFLNPGMLGRSQVFLRIAKARSLTPEEAALLRGALRPFILRRTKEEVLPDLPEKTEQLLLCDLDATERRLYDQLRTYYNRLLKDKVASVGLEKSKIHVLEALLRLRQTACHPGLVNAAHAHRKGSKIQVLLDHLQDAAGAGHKALVFSQFTSFLALVRRHLDELGLAYVYLDGKTRDRKAKVETFQTDPQIPIFLISLKAGGSGLNLTAADYVFLLDPWWNPAVEAQAIDRTHRIGQTRPVLAYRMIATDTVEEKVLQLQQTKRELAESILANDGSVLRQLTPEDLDYLLS